MKRLLMTLTVATIAAGSAASIAAADTYVYMPSGYSAYGYDMDGYSTEPSTGTYDQNYNFNQVPAVTNPSGEGGGVQNPRLGSGGNGSLIE